MTDEAQEEHAARAARTQSMFRAANERISTINEAFSHVLVHGDWVCECADPDCDERMQLTQAEYEGVRRLPTRFAVLPAEEHVFPEIETVTDRGERFWVVEKIGLAGELAARVAPARP